MRRPLGFAAAFALLCAGCGHPATRAECDEIFAKITEIELSSQKVSDPKASAERTEATRAAEGEVFATHCLGKRITESALRCVRASTTAAQLDRCL